MDEKQFRTAMLRARAIGGDYASGYQRGLRRLYHGESFGTAEEHSRWLALGLDGDPREDLGRGYRDGLAGERPNLEAD